MTSCFRCHRPVRLEKIHRLLVPVQLVRNQFGLRQLMDALLLLLVRLVGLLGADLKLGKASLHLVLELQGKAIQRTVPERLDKADRRQFQLLGLRSLIQSRDAAMGSQWCQLDQPRSHFQLGSGSCSRRLAAGLVGTKEPSTRGSSLPLDNQLAGRLMEQIQLGDHHLRLILDRVGHSCSRSGP